MTWGVILRKILKPIYSVRHMISIIQTPCMALVVVVKRQRDHGGSHAFRECAARHEQCPWIDTVEWKR